MLSVCLALLLLGVKSTAMMTLCQMMFSENNLLLIWLAGISRNKIRACGMMYFQNSWCGTLSFCGTVLSDCLPVHVMGRCLLCCFLLKNLLFYRTCKTLWAQRLFLCLLCFSFTEFALLQNLLSPLGTQTITSFSFLSVFLPQNLHLKNKWG